MSEDWVLNSSSSFLTVLIQQTFLFFCLLVIDIAYSPVVLKGAESDRVEQDQLIRLAMKYIEKQHKVTLCHSYHIAPFRQKGNLQTLRNRLDGQQKKPNPTKEKSQKGKFSHKFFR